MSFLDKPNASRGGAFVAKINRPLGSDSIGRWKGVAKGERVSRGTLGAKQLEFGDGLGNGGSMSGGYPPQREIRFIHSFEPFAAAKPSAKALIRSKLAAKSAMIGESMEPLIMPTLT